MGWLDNVNLNPKEDIGEGLFSLSNYDATGFEPLELDSGIANGYASGADVGWLDDLIGNSGKDGSTQIGSGMSNLGKGVGAFTDLYGLYAGSKSLGMSKDRLRMAEDNSLFSHQMDLGGLMAGITDQNAKKAFFGNSEAAQSIMDYIPRETLEKWNMGHLIGNNAPQSDYIKPISTGYEPLQTMGNKTEPYSLANPNTVNATGGSILEQNNANMGNYKLGKLPNTSMLNKTPQTGFMPLGEKRRGV